MSILIEGSVAELKDKYTDLSQPRLGAEIISVTDEFFAASERMLKPTDPVFIEGKFDDNGKWMDGWETRRRRVVGHDHCVLKICPGVVRTVNIDTSHFTGNYPHQASLEGCFSETQPDTNTQWVTLFESTELNGNAHNLIDSKADQVCNYLRLNIFPDGGIARLRVYGDVYKNWDALAPDEVVDLAAMEYGGRAVYAVDNHFGHMSNLNAPGKSINMGDGWETRRRRIPGYDWMVLRLAHAGQIERVELFTHFFKGNFPHEVSISAALLDHVNDSRAKQESMFWQELLPKQALAADSEFCFIEELNDIGPISHIRLNIFPDGGVSRLRMFGTIT